MSTAGGDDRPSHLGASSMSVEQEASVPSTLMPQRNSESILGDLPGSKEEPSTAPEDRIPPVTPSPPAPGTPDSHLRAWFESLSKEARLAALGVADHDVLTGLVSVAPWVRPGKDDPEGAAYTSRYIDWDAMVDMADWDDTRTSGATAEAVAPRPTLTPIPPVDPSQNSSHVFRIPDAVTDGSSARDHMALTKALLKHTRVIFPSAGQLAPPTEPPAEDPPIQRQPSAAPLLCIHPNVYQDLSEEDLLLALDTLSLSASQCPFLADESVPPPRRPPDGTMRLSDLWLHTLASAAAQWRLAGEEQVESQAHAIQRLVTTCRATQDFGAPTLAELSDSFLGPCPEPCFATAPMETLALTPLSWLVQHAQNRAAEQPAIDWHRLDEGLGKLLRRRTKPNATEPNATEPNTTKAQEEGSQWAPQSPGATASKRKKKAGKRNRNKTRTLSNADSISTTVGTSGDQVDQAPSAEKPREQDPGVPPVHPDTQRSVLAAQSGQKSLAIASDAGAGAAGKERTSLSGRVVVDGKTTDSGKTDHQVQEPVNQEVPLSRATNSVTEQRTKMSKGDMNSEKGHSDDNDDCAWETVEAKVRNNRKKGNNGPFGGNSGRNAHISNASDTGQSASDAQSHKKKMHHRAGVQKKGKNSRKAVRDILASLLDRVDEEVRRKAQQPRRTFAASSGGNAWKSGPPPVKKAPEKTADETVASAVAPKTDTASTSLRDIVLGRHSAQGAPRTGSNKTWAKAVKSEPSVQEKYANIVKTETIGGIENQKQTIAWKKEQGKLDSATPTKAWSKQNKNASADQNTAPTYQETLSSSSLTNAALKCSANGPDDRGSNSETSSGNTEEAAERTSLKLKAQSAEKKPEHVPPLPMLLNHDNANSANSSIASSLEAPHSTRHHHHHSNLPDVNDVGYHLLDVCDKLSRDMNLFMSRRALALNIRRQERHAILTALQDTVASIWPGMGHAEMYGSCATQTDLPSSDIDVVVVGLGFRESVQSPHDGAHVLTADFHGPSHSFDEAGAADSRRPSVPSHQVPITNVPQLQMQRMINAERVRRLATELEMKPWAVKVNAIPTATVPVVKVLADPSKLPGATLIDGWPNHSQVPNSSSVSISDSGSGASHQSTNIPHFVQQQHQYNPPWRGADIMNGLLSLDITFEGAGHGGIGSTQFSARVIADACEEAKVHPDETVLVQTMMVLKELLAQRKLNEPYSGGLSSYAVLLLVLALLQERAVIKEEVERAERQRRAMSIDVGSTSSFTAPQDFEATPKSGPVKSQHAVTAATTKLVQKTSRAMHHSGSSASSVSSWASIARKVGRQEPSLVEKGDSKNDPVDPSILTTGSRSTSQTSPHDGSVAQGQVCAPTQSTARSSKPYRDRVEVVSLESQTLGAQSLYPQGYNDIIEVLCTGETTAGKLLMHFLLYYGQQFDAQTTAIDVSGKHARTFSVPPFSYLSPYIPRRSAGTIDPVTGMLTVDPIVVYDPLEGAENNNVARRCFAWNSVRWIFAQSYATLSSAVERSATPPSSPLPPSIGVKSTSSSVVADELMDPTTPLLSCLLSF